MAKAKTKKTTKKAPARKRARTSKGRFVADDPSTPGNEAYVTEKQPFNNKWLVSILVVGVLIVIFVLTG
tara:strand:- start:631 stop:837 length:207 start_codon:yes stop_codon:yes gene_type:complete